jgi:hypothetical protein
LSGGSFERADPKRGPSASDHLRQHGDDAGQQVDAALVALFARGRAFQYTTVLSMIGPAFDIQDSLHRGPTAFDTVLMGSRAFQSLWSWRSISLLVARALGPRPQFIAALVVRA